MRISEQSLKRSAAGLQAMMLRWEQLHPVNAVQVAWLRPRLAADDVVSAAGRVFDRLAIVVGGLRRGPLFEFAHRHFVGDWRTFLEGVVGAELNRAYAADDPPWRLVLFESPAHGQFLALGYRHLIADARSVALVLYDIIRSVIAPGARARGPVTARRGAPLQALFRHELGLGRLPQAAWNHLREIWESRRSFRPPCAEPAELRMEFRIHAAELSIGALKEIGRRHGGTINDLICAAMLEWFARRFPPQARGNRQELALGVLADLTSRAAGCSDRAFGQYLSQYAVRATVGLEMPFGEIVGCAAEAGQRAKRLDRLIDNAQGFSLMARAWDVVPAVRRPAFLPALIPLLGGISNVHLSAITRDALLESAIQGYFRGTCVTNILPMMICVTTRGETCHVTTTHRPALFAAEEIADLVKHVASRLGGCASEAEASAARAA